MVMMWMIDPNILPWVGAPKLLLLRCVLLQRTQATDVGPSPTPVLSAIKFLPTLGVRGVNSNKINEKNKKIRDQKVSNTHDYDPYMIR